MLTAENVIITLKVAVVAVTLLLMASLTALALGRPRLHGRINYVFFVLTLTALLGLEVIVRVVDPEIFTRFFDRTNAWTALTIHLGFSMPAAVLLIAMLITGWKRILWLHKPLGIVFLVLWVGTFITGVFFLPHSQPPDLSPLP